MTRLLAPLVALVPVAALALGAPLAAQERPASPPLRPAEARWESLTREQQELVKERFRAWKAMEPERRRELEARHDTLRGVRGRLMEQLPPAERERVDQLEKREQKRALRPHLRRHLDAVRDEIRQGLGPDGVDGRELRMIRRALRDRTGERLVQLEDAGVLADGEAERLSSLSPWELGPELRRLGKLAVLNDPPKELLLLPDEERARIVALPPEPFHAALEELRPRGGPERGPGGLPREFRDAARGGAPRGRPIPRPVLERVFSPAEMQELEALAPAARAERVHALLREKARAAFEARGGGRGAWEKVEGMPRPLRERRYLKWIDPTLPLGAEPRGPRKELRGGGGGRNR